MTGVHNLIERHLCRDLLRELSALPHVEIDVPLRAAHVLLVSGQTVDARLLDQAPELQLVQKWGSGIDNVDEDALVARNVRLARTPGANAPSVAEHALALALLLMKGISPMIESLQKGAWSQAESVARGIAATRSSTLGIVGMGAVGSALAAMSRPVFAEVVAAGHGEGRTGAVDVRSVPLSDLLVRADVVVVSASWRAGRPPLIGPSEVASMGPSACLVNVARAALIDEGAVLDAVWSGGLGGFATDVPRGEPHLDDPRLRHPQVIVTPHIAGRDSGAIGMMNRCCVTNIRSLSCDGGGAELVGLVDQG